MCKVTVNRRIPSLFVSVPPPSGQYGGDEYRKPDSQAVAPASYASFEQQQQQTDYQAPATQSSHHGATAVAASESNPMIELVLNPQLAVPQNGNSLSFNGVASPFVAASPFCQQTMMQLSSPWAVAMSTTPSNMPAATESKMIDMTTPLIQPSASVFNFGQSTSAAAPALTSAAAAAAALDPSLLEPQRLPSTPESSADYYTGDESSNSSVSPAAAAAAVEWFNDTNGTTSASASSSYDMSSVFNQHAMAVPPTTAPMVFEDFTAPAATGMSNALPMELDQVSFDPVDNAAKMPPHGLGDDSLLLPESPHEYSSYHSEEDSSANSPTLSPYTSVAQFARRPNGNNGLVLSYGVPPQTPNALSIYNSDPNTPINVEDVLSSLNSIQGNPKLTSLVLLGALSLLQNANNKIAPHVPPPNIQSLALPSAMSTASPLVELPAATQRVAPAAAITTASVPALVSATTKELSASMSRVAPSQTASTVASIAASAKRRAAATAVNHRSRAVISKPKPYVCRWKDCGRSFADASNAKRHEMSHISFKPFDCPLCAPAASFTRRSALRNHMVSQHGCKSDNPIMLEALKRHGHSRTTVSRPSELNLALSLRR